MLFALVLGLWAFAVAARAALSRFSPAIAGLRPDDLRAFALALPVAMAGVTHFSSPGRFLAMLPDVHGARWAVWLSGAAEIALALALLRRAWRVRAAWGLIALFVAVFPANVFVAITGRFVDGLPEAHWYYWLRLPIQLAFIGWAWSLTQRPMRADPARP